MQKRVNAELVVFSDKSQGQADRDSQYKIDKTKEWSKTESRSKSEIQCIKVQKGQAGIVNRAEFKNQEYDVRINQGIRDTRISILLPYLELGSRIRSTFWQHVFAQTEV